MAAAVRYFEDDSRHQWKNGVLRRVAELPPDARRAMEAVFGRPLAEHEAIALNVDRPAPTEAPREETSCRLLERIDKTALKVRGVRDAEIKARSTRL